MNTSLAVERRDDILLEQLNMRSYRQDDIDSWIDDRAEELIKNFGNGNDWQIVAKINELLGGYVDADVYNQFITDACYSQARYEFNATKNITPFNRRGDY